jgi:hypothetical protein
MTLVGVQAVVDGRETTTDHLCTILHFHLPATVILGLGPRTHRGAETTVDIGAHCGSKDQLQRQRRLRHGSWAKAQDGTRGGVCSGGRS